MKESKRGFDRVAQMRELVRAEMEKQGREWSGFDHACFQSAYAFAVAITGIEDSLASIASSLAGIDSFLRDFVAPLVSAQWGAKVDRLTTPGQTPRPRKKKGVAQ